MCEIFLFPLSYHSNSILLIFCAPKQIPLYVLVLYNEEAIW